MEPTAIEGAALLVAGAANNRETARWQGLSWTILRRRERWETRRRVGADWRPRFLGEDLAERPSTRHELSDEVSGLTADLELEVRQGFFAAPFSALQLVKKNRQRSKQG